MVSTQIILAFSSACSLWGLGVQWPPLEVRQKVMLLPTAPLFAATSFEHHWPKRLAVPWHLSPCMSLVSRIVPHFQHLSSRQDLNLFLFTSLLSETTSFGGAFLFHPLFFLGPQPPNFPNLSSLCAEAQHMTALQLLVQSHASLFIGGFKAWHFCLVYVLRKFTTCLYQLHAASRRQHKSLILDIPPHHSPCSYVPPDSISQFKLLVLPFAKWHTHFLHLLLPATVFLQQIYCEGREYNGKTSTSTARSS